MPAFDRIFADVRKDLPSVADAVLRQELFRVMDDFTQRTNIWQEEVPIHVTPYVWTYNFKTETGQPNRLLLMYDSPLVVDPRIFPPLNTLPPPSAFWPDGPVAMRVPGTLVFYRQPTTAGDRMVVVAKRTSEPLTVDHYPTIDDWIPDKYADTIGRGIIARLQLEPQKPYSNPMLAKANQLAYISGCSLARANDSHANVLDGQRWMYPQNWSTVTRKPWT